MSDQSDNVVLEHLRHIRRKVDEIGEDLLNVKSRLSNVEVSVGQLNQRLDRVDLRLDRIETRLDLSEAPNPAAE